MGRWGSRIVRELAAAPGDIIFHKDSLTFFYNGAAEKLLRGLGATKLYVAGVATEYCVKWCVLDALARGFAVTVIEDAIAGVDLKEGDVDRAVEAMPEALRGKYQYFTEAKMERLRAAGYDRPFTGLEDGVDDYVRGYLSGADPYL